MLQFGQHKGHVDYKKWSASAVAKGLLQGERGICLSLRCFLLEIWGGALLLLLLALTV